MKDLHRFILFISVFICFIPPISRCFYDEYISPKWYLSIFIVLLFLIWCLISKYRFHIEKRHISLYATIILFLECLYSLSYEYTNVFNDYGITGSFDNPAVLALHLLLLLPFTFIRFNTKKHLWEICKIIVITFSIITLLLTKSRTGLICLGIDSIFLIFIKIRHHIKLKILITTCALSIIAFVCLTQKLESTSGRRFIIQTTYNLIKDNPITGHGKNSFIRLYMANQGNYLHNHPNCKYAYLADEVYHPLNEFMNIWLDYGVLGMLLYIILLSIPTLYFIKRKQWSCCMVFITLFIFSFFSYPLYYPLPVFIIILGNSWYIYNAFISKSQLYARTINNEKLKKNLRILFLTGLCFILGYMCYDYSFEYEWSVISRNAEHGYVKRMLPRYKRLYKHYNNNSSFLYNYTLIQFQAAELSDALSTSKKLHLIMSGYNLDLLTGDIYRHLHDNKSAIKYYQSAYDMCPCRFAPLEGMLLSYQYDNNLNKADSIAKIIINKKIKVPSSEVSDIIETAKDWLKKENHNQTINTTKE